MASLLALSVLMGASLGLAENAAGKSLPSAADCQDRKIRTADGCQRPAAVGQELTRIIKGDRQAAKLRAVIARIEIAGKKILRRGFGNSQTGVPATPNMNFRIGSMVIPVLTSVIYQLHEEDRIKLNDPISTWLPGLPGASQITVRMLMNNTSGYLDWIQKNPPFQNKVIADPFHLWSGSDLLSTALDRGFSCPPGTCFSYAHTNFLILTRILRKLEPESTVVAELRERLLRPLGIKMAFSRLAPIPFPALSAYTTERNIFEESTGWSPSWGLGQGMLATASIDNVTKLGKGILSGRRLSSRSRADFVRQYAPGLGPDPASTYFAQGFIEVNGWRRQNPYFNGYMGNVGWFPAKRIVVSLVGTTGPDTTVPDGENVTDDILADIAEYLTPSNSPALPKPPG